MANEAIKLHHRRSAKLLVISGVSGFIFVALGAFAAHSLSSILSDYFIAVFKTGVQYQALHTLAVMACAILLRSNSNEKVQKGLFRAAICFIIGILCFSGSLYGLALTGMKWFGPITPIGGVMFLIGWVFFVYSALHINEVAQ
ncbi:DUF423 domain-containing protein [Vibrio sp. VB16]|uniref:DUF423 domain-containing protein n=1 Tax=Vibrio sp. VB16 TaxID=2785746 RepID=UPI00189E13FC|nr:DUF423 domain-containing protein [Vibrio sp. VB16]UGA56366.1 DUF423 domain-containing protein [Vibrio sp. VB16]